MASTNKTTNYELSQFVATDKPAWLQDYNSDMGKIDTAVKNASDSASSASGVANAVSTSVGDISNLTTTDKNDVVSAVNEVKTDAQTAYNLANTASTNASKALGDLQKLNLTTIGTCTVSYTVNNGSPVSVSDSNLKFAKDSSNSVFKVYGHAVVGNLQRVSGTLKVTISGLNFSNDSNYTINAMVLRLPKYVNDNAYTFISDQPVEVKSNGDLEISWNIDGDIDNIRFIFFPCVYFNKNFGD